MKIGILGQGSIGSRHARNLQIMGHEVLAHDPALKVSMSRDQVIVQSEAVIIATPTPQHFNDLDSIVAISNGKPVFVEKPIGDKFFSENADYNAYLNTTMVGYNLRFHKCIIQAKKWLDNGDIGKPLWASFTCAQFNDKPAYLRDGVCLNWSHEIDLALYLLGPARVAAAWARITSGNEDVIDIWLQHDSGARSTIHLDYLTKPEVREFWIAGDRNRIGVDLTGGMISLGKTATTTGGTIDATYIDEMKAFIERIGGKQTIGATGQDGLDVLNICLESKKMAGIL